MPGADRLNRRVRFDRRMLRRILLEERAQINSANGVLVTSSGVKHSIKGTRPRGVPVQFFARIETNEPDSANRWRYTYAQVHKSTLGPGGWATYEGARTGPAWNTIEDMNSDTGIQGNGVNVDTLPAGFTIQPAPVGVIVQVTIVQDAVSARIEGQFSYVNAVDGECA